MIKTVMCKGSTAMDDNVWEYPFGDLDEDDDILFRQPADCARHPRQI